MILEKKWDNLYQKHNMQFELASFFYNYLFLSKL